MKSIVRSFDLKNPFPNQGLQARSVQYTKTSNKHWADHRWNDLIISFYLDFSIRWWESEILPIDVSYRSRRGRITRVSVCECGCTMQNTNLGLWLRVYYGGLGKHESHSVIAGLRWWFWMKEDSLTKRLILHLHWTSIFNTGITKFKANMSRKRKKVNSNKIQTPDKSNRVIRKRIPVFLFKLSGIDCN